MRIISLAGALLFGAFAIFPATSAAQADDVFFDGFDCRLWFPDGDGDDFGTATGAVLTCDPPAGFVLNDDDCDDGDPATNPAAVDDPDANALDRNCDGIDGTIVAAVFVWPGGSNTGQCTIVEPCATLPFAFTRLTPQRPSIYMRAGTYVVGLVTLPDVSIYGGFDDAWQRSTNSFDAAHLVEIGGTFVSTEAAIVFQKQSGSARIAFVRIDAPDATTAGTSSYAIRVVNATLNLDGVEVLQGNGAAGTAGADGRDRDLESLDDATQLIRDLA